MILGLWFQARNLKLSFAPDHSTDRFYFESDRIHFAVSPLHLLFGRILLIKAFLGTAYFEYINRIDSHKKNWLLPRRQSASSEQTRPQPDLYGCGCYFGYEA